MRKEYTYWIKMVFSLSFLGWVNVLDVEAASRFMVACVISCTWDASNTTIWSSTSGGTPGSSVPSSSDTVTLDGSSGGGIVTVNTNISIQSLTTSAFTGTLDFSANNNTVSLSVSPCWTDSATGVHTTNMGNGTWTFAIATGTAITLTASANHTLNANGSTILLSAVPTGNRTVSLGAKTVNNLMVTNAAWQPFQIDLSQGGAIVVGGNLTLTNVGNIRMPAGVTITVTGTLTWDGTSSNQGLIASPGVAAILSVGSTNILSWLLIQNITKSGAGSITVNNGFDGGGNTGITINGPRGSKIIGGWLFDNENQPMFLDKAA